MKLSEILTLCLAISSASIGYSWQSVRQLLGPSRRHACSTVAAATSESSLLPMSRLNSFDHVDWQSVLNDIASDIQPHLENGEVASYIPALAQVDPSQFGIAFTDIRGITYKAGVSADTPFSIQSISKVFALVMALDLEGEALWQRVGREPSGSKFNSIVQLENEQGRPRNPFINAGAIAVTNSIQQYYCNNNNNNCDDEKDYKQQYTHKTSPEEYNSVAIDKILDSLKTCAQPATEDAIRIDPDVARSEALFGDRNRALAYFMRSYGVVQGDIGQTLHTYFHQCALEMSVTTLSRAGLFLAAAGANPLAVNSKENDNSMMMVTSHDHVDRVNSLMMLCGHYDMSGDFAFRVGLAGKSGVGGGILAVAPEVGTLAVWSPRLNQAGNSYAGTLALEWFSKRTGVNLF